MSDALRDWWAVWLFFAVLGWVGDAVSTRLIYWQRKHIEQLKRSEGALRARLDPCGHGLHQWTGSGYVPGRATCRFCGLTLDEFRAAAPTEEPQQ